MWRIFENNSKEHNEIILTDDNSNQIIQKIWLKRFNDKGQNIRIFVELSKQSGVETYHSLISSFKGIDQPFCIFDNPYLTNNHISFVVVDIESANNFLKALFLIKDSNIPNFMQAAMLHHLEMYFFTELEDETNPNATNSLNDSVAHIAIKTGKISNLKALVENDPSVIHQVNHRGETPLTEAVKQNYEVMIGYLIAKGSVVDEKTLLATINAGHSNLLPYLLEKGRFNRDTLNIFLLNIQYKNQPAMEKALIQAMYPQFYKKNKVGSEDLALLNHACRSGNFWVADSLLKLGANPNIGGKFGFKPIHWAVIRNDMALVMVLLNNQANPNAKDPSGASSIHWAAWMGHIEILDFLVSKANDLKINIDINEMSSTGKTALMGAARAGHVFVVGYLLKRNVEITEKAIQEAMQGHSPKIAILLIQKSNLNSKALNALLIYFLQKRKTWEETDHNIVKILIEKGANPNVINNFGSTALDIFVSYNPEGFSSTTEASNSNARMNTLKFLLESGAESQRIPELIKKVQKDSPEAALLLKNNLIKLLSMPISLQRISNAFFNNRNTNSLDKTEEKANEEKIAFPSFKYGNSVDEVD